MNDINDFLYIVQIHRNLMVLATSVVVNVSVPYHELLLFVLFLGLGGQFLRLMSINVYESKDSLLLRALIVAGFVFGNSIMPNKQYVRHAATF